uniref:Uncharacterized protein n=1 Tax=Percolomonas cosmopolitus TaxID=63605 RepID=A0A7S1KPT9_9EUKA|mmetsp:Transcript_4428/g.16696  ORF Transcript_4428/g.16696 Transcript_4428/m.16696 type:complete len:227 (+) Transcript_4428:183-863(+)
MSHQSALSKYDSLLHQKRQIQQHALLLLERHLLAHQHQVYALESEIETLSGRNSREIVPQTAESVGGTAMAPMALQQNELNDDFSEFSPQPHMNLNLRHFEEEESREERRQTSDVRREQRLAARQPVPSTQQRSTPQQQNKQQKPEKTSESTLFEASNVSDTLSRLQKVQPNPFLSSTSKFDEMLVLSPNSSTQRTPGGSVTKEDIIRRIRESSSRGEFLGGESAP